MTTSRCRHSRRARRGGVSILAAPGGFIWVCHCGAVRHSANGPWARDRAEDDWARDRVAAIRAEAESWVAGERDIHHDLTAVEQDEARAIARDPVRR